MKTKMLLYSAVVVLYSCGAGKKTPKGEVAYEVPCSGDKYMPNSKFLRASGDGVGHITSNAKSVAMSNAFKNLSQEMTSTVKVVTDNYLKQVLQNTGVTDKNRFEELGRTVSENIISNARRICEKTTKITDGPKKGLFKHYIAYEIPVNQILEGFSNAVSNDKELRIDYDYEKFKKTFDEEMEKRKSESR